MPYKSGVWHSNVVTSVSYTHMQIGSTPNLKPMVHLNTLLPDRLSLVGGDSYLRSIDSRFRMSVY